MLVEITGITISEDTINITANNLESILLAEDLYQDIVEEPVQYTFDRHAKGGAHMKYLYRVVNSQARCRSAKSFGEKLEKLTGVITTLSDGFRVKA